MENYPKGPPAAKNTQNQVILILIVLLILMFLALIILTSLLFIKFNRSTSELQRNVENIKSNMSCESGWLEFDGHCYFLSNFELNWTNAEKMCLNREGHLVIMNSEAEQNFLRKYLNKRYHWIGLTDIEKEGTFQWIDGTELSYTFWANEEPNDDDKNEDCAHLFPSGKWNDHVCSLNLNAICEKRLI